jgi:hypothetical protein
MKYKYNIFYEKKYFRNTFLVPVFVKNRLILLSFLG